LAKPTVAPNAPIDGREAKSANPEKTSQDDGFHPMAPQQMASIRPHLNGANHGANPDARDCETFQSTPIVLPDMGYFPVETLSFPIG
jgi:hypothetical protein